MAANPRLLAPCGESPASPLAMSAVSAHSVSRESPLSGASSVSCRALAEVTFLPHSLAPGGGAPLASLAQKKNEEGLEPTENMPLSAHAADMLRKELFSVRVAGRYKADLVGACLFMRHGARTPKENFSISATGTESSRFPPGDIGRSPSEADRNRAAAGDNSGAKPQKPGYPGVPVVAAAEPQAIVPEAGKTGEKSSQNGLVQHPTGTPKRPRESRNEAGWKSESRSVSLASDGGSFKETPDTKSVPRQGEGTSSGLPYGIEERQEAANGAEEHIPKGGSVDPSVVHVSQAHACRREAGEHGTALSTARPSDSRGPTVWRPPSIAGSGCGAFSMNSFVEAVGGNRVTSSVVNGAQRGLLGHVPREHSPARSSPPGAEIDADAPAGLAPEMPCCPEETEEKKGAGAAHSIAAQVETSKERANSRVIKDHSVSANKAPSGCWFGVVPMGPCGGHPANRAQQVRTSLSFLAFPPTPLSPQSPDPTSTASSSSSTPISSRSRSCSSGAEAALAVVAGASPQTWRAVSPKAARGPKGRPAFTPTYGFEKTLSSDAVLPAASKAGTPMPALPCKASPSVATLPLASTLPCRPEVLLQTPGVAEVSPARSVLLTPGRSPSAPQGAACPFNCAPGLLTAAGWQQAACIGCALRRKQRIILRNAFLRECLETLEGGEEAREGGGRSQPLQIQGAPFRGADSACREGGTRSMGRPLDRGESPMQEHSAYAETHKDQTLLQPTDASESCGVSASSCLSPRSRASDALASSLTAPGRAASCPQCRSSLPQSCNPSHDSSTSTHVDPCAAACLHVCPSVFSPSVSSSVSSRSGNSSCSAAGSISGAGCPGAPLAGCGHPPAFSTSPQGVWSSTAAPELPTNSDFQGFILDRCSSLFLCSTESLRCQQTAEGVLAGLLHGPGAFREIRRPCGSLEAVGGRPASPQSGTVCKPFDSCTEQASARLFVAPRSARETRGGDRAKTEVNGKKGDLGGERQSAGREEMKGGGRWPHAKEENAAGPLRGGFPGPFEAWGRTRGVCLHVAPSGSPLASALKAKSQIVKFLKQRCLAESVCYQRACLQLRAESDLLRQLTGWEEKAGLKVMKKFVSSYSTYLFHGVPPPPLSNGVIQSRPATADAPTTASFATFFGDLSRQSSALFSPFDEAHAVSMSPPLSRQRSSSPSQAARPLAPEAARSAGLAEGRETKQWGLEGSEERRNGDTACGRSSEQDPSAPGASLERRAEASRQLTTQEVDAEKEQKEEAPDAPVSLLQAIFLGADVITRLQFGEEEEVGWRAGGTSLLELASRLERMADWCLEREQSCHATQQTPGRKPARASRSTPFPSADKTHREKEWPAPECETRRQSGGEHEQETDVAKGAAEEFEDRSEQASGTEPPLLQIFVTHQSALLALQGALSVPTEELHVPAFGCYISAELLRLNRSSAGDDWDYPIVGDEAKGTADAEERREESRAERVGRKTWKQGERSHSPWFSYLEFDKQRENKAGCGGSPLSPLHALSRSEEELSSCTSTPRTAPTDESSSLSCSLVSGRASAATDSVESHGTSFEGDRGYPPSNQSAREMVGFQLSSSVPSYTAENAASPISLPVPEVPVSPSSPATQPSSRPPVSHPFLEKLTSRKPREARKKHPGYLIRWTINGSQPVVLPPSLRFKPPSQPPFYVSGSPSASASASSPVSSVSLSLASLSSRGEGQEERDKATLAAKLEQALQERGERLYALQHCAAASEYSAADALVRSVLAEEASFLSRFPLLKDAEPRVGMQGEEQAGGLEMHGCVPPQEAEGESGPGGACGAVSSTQVTLVDPEEITQFLCCRQMPCFCFHCLQRAERRLWSQRQRTGQGSETGRLNEVEPGKNEGGTGRGQEGETTHDEERLYEENELDFETCNIVELDRLLSFLDERIAKYGMPIPVGDDSRSHPELALQTQARDGKGDACAKKRDAELETVRHNV
ncbi:hypothetical protein TGME49_253490 [Toxoplasma gondii ME49]|uniref:Phosphoglycerate mutase family protein n=2 Tax=Toxoplasma gondii TaxID=5811 RepID=S8FDQ5_TOXGM|nr:hypothetical protein TGME49_253490 [Toxoplasma gondii ME49]EPT31808.1 hypothetical protein TGME49_253490 [Toxoplasma gondii ME49]KYF41888.1 hypothetical protein TGARI_253490 [Toxoplasma gondii ARI]|eukprot:XP_018638180.1 hypothetical protein TGME49_253490 [Toxoplasma gondii ME49]